MRKASASCDSMAKERLAAIHKQPFVLFSSVGVHPLRRAQQAGKYAALYLTNNL